MAGNDEWPALPEITEDDLAQIQPCKFTNMALMYPAINKPPDLPKSFFEGVNPLNISKVTASMTKYDLPCSTDPQAANAIYILKEIFKSLGTPKKFLYCTSSGYPGLVCQWILNFTFEMFRGQGTHPEVTNMLKQHFERRLNNANVTVQYSHNGKTKCYIAIFDLINCPIHTHQDFCQDLQQWVNSTPTNHLPMRCSADTTNEEVQIGQGNFPNSCLPFAHERNMDLMVNAENSLFGGSNEDVFAKSEGEFKKDTFGFNFSNSAIKIESCDEFDEDDCTIVKMEKQLS